MKGYNATGIQEIATEAGIPKGSFYTYFSSKEDFGVAVIRYYTQNSLASFQERLEEASKQEDASEQEDAYHALAKVFISITEKYKSAPIKKGCLLGNLGAEISEASEECRMELQRSVRQYIEVLTERITIGQSLGKVRKDIPAQHLAEFIWDCWQGSLLRMKIEGSVEPVSRNLELLFHGILS
ncbi:MAG: TetR family transcriptional regulator C-terminal domain-containing protein [Vallitaleaceae bacterium]|nr:TetR family transcriptional regulator C-terminal domain-containing protein [Vallitaleaceae bacterium]